VAGGLHGSNRLGGNSLGDLLVFGRRAGLHAALYCKNLGGRLTVDAGQVESIAGTMLEPFDRSGGENPYAIQTELQETMHTLVGIIRVEAELKEALKKLEAFKQRAAKVRVEGGRIYNPGWHTALDLASLLTVAECCALAALERKESRGGTPARITRIPTTPGGREPGRPAAGRSGGPAARAAAPDAPELKALFQERK